MLRPCVLGVIGPTIITTPLSGLTSLRHLQLSLNGTLDLPCDMVGLDLVACSLKQLTQLELSVLLPSHCVSALMPALNSCSMLRHLMLTIQLDSTLPGQLSMPELDTLDLRVWLDIPYLDAFCGFTGCLTQLTKLSSLTCSAHCKYDSICLPFAHNSQRSLQLAPLVNVNSTLQVLSLKALAAPDLDAVLSALTALKQLHLHSVTAPFSNLTTSPHPLLEDVQVLSCASMPLYVTAVQVKLLCKPSCNKLVYDAACLYEADYHNLLQSTPHLRHLELPNFSWVPMDAFACLIDLQHLELPKLSREHSLQSLSGLTKLTSLNIRKYVEPAEPGRHRALAALSYLSALTALQSLTLNYLQPSSVEPMSELSLLTHLSLRAAAAQDLTPLSSLVQLVLLDLHASTAKRLEPLCNLRQLRHLDLSSSETTSLTALSGLMHLSQLLIASSRARSVSPLSGLCKLRLLDISLNKYASEWDALGHLLALRRLYVSGYQQAGVQRLQRALIKSTTQAFAANKARMASPMVIYDSGPRRLWTDVQLLASC
eukprot:jgi/Chrzof1/8969/Cz03g31110.t1